MEQKEFRIDHGIAAFRIVYWGFFLCLGGQAAWQLVRTIHATPEGLEYRFLDRREKLVPWSAFSCAYRGRLPQSKVDEIWLIPVECGEFPGEFRERQAFLGANYAEITRFYRTKNNIRAVEAYLGEVKT